ncbi:hypothetical protein FB550_10560 [Neobacillus bataviensis]|uniref:Uncharacterized protein n=1 Tax=Neobacillus bataviensis TaxID=220685 RepID=A0A561DE72_9BACI|nr:hypothetical protein [Neobacillus bataviensis]TWE01694.1 hypothetical protein FB550_10560 [Neobacillus bataviensis]
METDQIHKVNFNMENMDGKIEVKGEISGAAKIPNHDDLKFKAIIALLNSIDKQNFIVTENLPLFVTYVKEIEETIMEVSKYESFQGKNIRRE